MAERPVGRVDALHVKDGHFHGEALQRRPLSEEEALVASKSCAYASRQFRKHMRLSGRWLAQLRKHNEDYGEGQPFWITVQKGNRNFCDQAPDTFTGVLRGTGNVLSGTGNVLLMLLLLCPQASFAK